MSSIVVKAENISKAYQIGEFSTGTISQDIERWFAKMRGKEDRFLKIGETNDRTIKGKSNVVWSLKDINFEINQGDAVGIIGRNGAGKSTLLKVLSRVTSPTTGNIKAKGRIASLLEVGTGFHPELTGRENIFLNGAILGMRKNDIKKHFDAIVEFAGVERYVDTPVKRYSSGMYVRLAFAVAAHLDSEILIVDEVLAVGDAEFQKKCLGKIGDISKGEGRTVLFVSHNMNSIKALCKTGIFMRSGSISKIDKVDAVIDAYLNSYKSLTSYNVVKSEMIEENRGGKFTVIRFKTENGEENNIFQIGTNPNIEVEYGLYEDVVNFNVGIFLTDIYETHIYSSADTDFNLNMINRRKGKYKAVVPLNLHNLNTGTYKIKFMMGIINVDLFDSVELTFFVESNNFLNTGTRPGLLISLNKWEYI